MKYCTILLCTLILTFITVPLVAQQIGDPEKSANGPSILGSNAEGTHFIVGFMQNEESTSLCSLIDGRDISRQSILVASPSQTIVTLTYPDGTRIQRQLQPFQIATFVLTGEQYECLGEGICDKSFEITSNDPICVYCFSSKSQTSDGYLALPLRSWGKEYYTPNYFLDEYDADPRRDPDGCNLEPRGGEFMVIAGEDSTTVTVWPKVRTAGGNPGGVSVEKILMKGEMWQIQDGGMVRGGSDMTGSHIIADKPIGLLSGHVRTGIPWTQPTKDHIIEMIPPKEALGTQHMIVPFGGRKGGDLVRIIASEPGITTATVTTNSGRVRYLINGAGAFQEMTVTNVSLIETDQPVLVAHYSQSNGIDPTSSFDPDMIITTPTEQFVNAALFQTIANGAVNPATGRSQFDQHFVTLVVEKKNYASMTLNGQSLVGYPSIIATGSIPGLNNEYSWVTIRLPGGQAYRIEGNALFGGYVYGLGQYDSYGWPVGAGLRNLEIEDETAPKLTATPSCGKQWYDIVATDSGQYDLGLAEVWLDRTVSSNVDTLTASSCVCGATVYHMQVRLVDPDKPGKARIIAKDNAGNLDTIEVDLYAVKPTFSHSSIEFLKIEVDKLYQDNFVVTNSSAGEWIKFDSIRLKRGVEFKIVGLGSGDVINQAIVPGQNFELLISFRAPSEGTYQDTLLVYIDCRVYKIPLLATTAAPIIDTKDVDYGTVRVGRLKCLEVPVTNTGDGKLEIHEVRLNGKRAIFVFDKNGVPGDTIWLDPGESTVVVICFEPDEAIDFTGTVQFISNAAAGKSISNLTGKGIYPRISIGGYDFGAVQVGDTACTTVPIVNSGSDTAFLTGVTIADNVFVEDKSVFPSALPPGDTLWVPICFVPDEEEKGFSSPIGANNTDGLEAVASLNGRSYQLLAEIDGYNWGERWVGTKHDTIVHIRNLTDHAIEIDNIWIANGDEGDFEVLTQLSAPVTLGPKEEYPVDVRFAPLVRGARSVGIYASTNSRLRPVIENVLEGFGIQALPADELVHDSTTMFSCDSRISRVLIYNRGNAPLTISNITFDNPSGLASLNAPNPGYQIPVGDDPLELEITFDMNGYVGEASASVSWSFTELPGEEYNRTIAVRSEQQTYEISGAAPTQIDIGEHFNLFVTVDKAFWKNMPQSEVKLDIRYNPTVVLFDKDQWYTLVGNPGQNWTFVGAPEFPDSSSVRLVLHPTQGMAIPLEGTTFPAIPFRGFLGNSDLDTFSIAMTAGTSACVLPTAAALPYSVEKICGLRGRLLEIAGQPPVLKESRPNPASSSIAIDFTIPFEGPARLELFSLDGKKIRGIIDGSVTAGDHTIMVDVRELTNGVYYYRLEYGDFTASQALIVRR